MKKLILVAFVLFTVACSAAQKSAEKDLVVTNVECSAKCAVSDLNRSAETMLSQCAEQCGEKAVTDPQQVRDVLNIFAGAQASALKAGAKLPAIADAGAK